MKKYNYILFIFITSLMLFIPLKTKAMTYQDPEIPFTKEEMTTYVNEIKSSAKFNEIIKTYSKYAILYRPMNSNPNVVNDTVRWSNVNMMTVCFTENPTTSAYLRNESLACDNTLNYYINENKLNDETEYSYRSIYFNLNYLSYLIDVNFEFTINQDYLNSNGDVLYKSGENIFKSTYLNPDTEIDPPVILPEYTKTFNIFGIPVLMSYDYYIENIVEVHFTDLNLTDDSKFIVYIILNLFLLMFWFAIGKVIYTFVIYLKNSL